MPVLPSFTANQWTGFYMRATLALNGLMNFLSSEYEFFNQPLILLKLWTRTISGRLRKSLWVFHPIGQNLSDVCSCFTQTFFSNFRTTVTANVQSVFCFAHKVEVSLWLLIKATNFKCLKCSNKSFSSPLSLNIVC